MKNRSTAHKSDIFFDCFYFDNIIITKQYSLKMMRIKATVYTILFSHKFYITFKISFILICFVWVLQERTKKKNEKETKRRKKK